MQINCLVFSQSYIYLSRAFEIDYVLLLAIVLAVYLFIGIFPFSKSTRENFLISGRRLGGASNGFSIAASKIGGGLLVSYSTLFFAFKLLDESKK